MAYSPRGEHGIVPELTEEQKLKNQQPLGTELRKEATALYERLPEPVKEVTEGVGNVVGKGLFGYVDENNTFQKGLLHSEMNPLGLQPIDPLRGYSAVMQAGAKATNVDPFVFEFGADLLLGGVMSRVGRFKPTPSTFRGAAAAIENLPPETLFKIDLPSILNQTPGGSYAFMSTTQPLVGKSPIRQAFTNIPPGATITQPKKALGPTKHYRRLSKKYQYITPDQLAGDKELLRRMQGREKADIANRQDLDAFFTNLNQDQRNLGTMLQKMGRDLNVKKSDQDFLSILPDLNKYGISMKETKGGGFEMFNSRTGKTATQAELDSAVNKVKQNKK